MASAYRRRDTAVQRRWTPCYDGAVPDALPIAPLGADPGVFQPLQHFLKYAQFAAGRAPVMRLEEPSNPALLEARLEQLRREWPQARQRVLEPSWARGRQVVILVGAHAHLVDGASRAEQALWRGPSHPQFARALLALGRLLGFPSCCVRALALAGRSQTREVEQLRVCGLLHRPPPTDQHPFLVPYVPCRPDCPAMQDLVAAIARDDGGWIDRWAAAYALGDAAWRTWGTHGTILDLDRPGQLAVVRVGEGPRPILEPVLVFARDTRLRTLGPRTVWPLAGGAEDDALALIGPRGLVDLDGTWSRRCNEACGEAPRG